jgi:hypothetical protein
MYIIITFYYILYIVSSLLIYVLKEIRFNGLSAIADTPSRAYCIQNAGPFPLVRHFAHERRGIACTCSDNDSGTTQLFCYCSLFRCGASAVSTTCIYLLILTCQRLRLLMTSGEE